MSDVTVGTMIELTEEGKVRFYANPVVGGGAVDIEVGTGATPNYADGEWHYARMHLTTAVSLLSYRVDDASSSVTAVVSSRDPNQASIGGHKYSDTLDEASGLLVWNKLGGDIDEVVIGQVIDTSLYEAGSAPWDNNLTSARITNILGAVGWPQADRALDTGNTTLAAFVDDVGSSALDACLTATESEGGVFFIDKSGNAAFHNRHKRSRTNVEDTYSDAAGSRRVPYYDIKWFRDDIELRTVASVTQQNCEAVEIVGSNETTYGPRSVAITSHTNTATEPVDYANWLISEFGTPRTRFVIDQRVGGGAASYDQWNSLLTRELGDLLNVEHEPIGGGTAIDADVFVEEIDMSISSHLWEMTVRCSPAEGQRMFTIGTSGLGTIETGAPIGW